MSARIRLGRLFGIPIGIQPAWLLIVALIAWSLGSGYYPEQVPGISGPAAYGLGLASALLLFGGVLLHELGHALVARRRGVRIEEIDLWLLGGVARMSGQPTRAADELAFAAAGPAVTLILVLLFAALAVLAPSHSAGGALLDYLVFVNAAILVLNLLPAFPLDGGRIARALFWSRDGDLRKATAIAARLGRAIGWALVAFGVFAATAGSFSGFWLAIIGVFVIFAAKAEERSTRLRVDLRGRPVGALASPFPGGALEVERHLEGLDPELLVDADTDLAELVERPAFAAHGEAVVRRADGGYGVVTAADVADLVRAVELAANPQAGRRVRADARGGEGKESGPMFRSRGRKAQ